MSVNQLLSVKQACDQLAISRSQLWCLIRAGRIRTVPIGTRGIRIAQSELDRFTREAMGEAEGGENLD